MKFLTPTKAFCVLAVAPCVQGIGYIVFHGPRSPIDWGIKWTRKEKSDEMKNIKSLEKVTELIDRYHPKVVIFEDPHGKGARRAMRVRNLLDAIALMVEARHIGSTRYSRDQVRQAFSGAGAMTKHQIARDIARQLPELAPRLPAERKIWLPEHANMSIFDAASLALTFFASRPGIENEFDEGLNNERVDDASDARDDQLGRPG